MGIFDKIFGKKKPEKSSVESQSEKEQYIRSSLKKVQNNEITDKEFIRLIEKNDLTHFYNENQNTNLINLLVGTFNSGSPIKVTLLEYFLKKGIDPNLLSKKKKWNSLYSCKQNYEIAKLLIENGADVHNLDTNGSSFIMYGTNLEVYKLAVKYNINLTVINNNGYNFLLTLFTQNYGHSDEIRNDQKEILNDLLNRKLFDINKLYAKNLTILNFALIYGDISIDCIELLSQNGVNPKIKLNQSLEFRNWSGELIPLNPEFDTYDILNAKLNSLIDDNKKGLVTEEIYFNQGLNYYENAIGILNKNCG